MYCDYCHEDNKEQYDGININHSLQENRTQMCQDCFLILKGLSKKDNICNEFITCIIATDNMTKILEQDAVMRIGRQIDDEYDYEQQDEDIAFIKETVSEIKENYTFILNNIDYVSVRITMVLLFKDIADNSEGVIQKQIKEMLAIKQVTFKAFKEEFKRRYKREKKAYSKKDIEILIKKNGYTAMNMEFYTEDIILNEWEKYKGE